MLHLVRFTPPQGWRLSVTQLTTEADRAFAAGDRLRCTSIIDAVYSIIDDIDDAEKLHASAERNLERTLFRLRKPD